MRRFVEALLVIALASTALTARGDAIEARYFDERARDAFAHHHYAEALDLFLQVESAAPSAGTLYNIGVSADHAGQPAVAYAHLHEFLEAESGDDPAHRADAEQRLRRLEGSLALVRVVTDPPGATVWVDRRELGAWGETPQSLVLEPGPHTVELELEGHRTERVAVVAVVGEAHDVAARLAAELGDVQVRSVPGARIVAVDAMGVEHEIPDAATIALPVGPYRVRAELAGHRSDEREIAVRAGTTEVLTLTPTPITPPTGRLLVTTGAVRATLNIDGTARGETPARIDSIEEGERAIEISAEGYVTWRGTVAIVADRATFLDITLVAAR